MIGLVTLPLAKAEVDSKVGTSQALRMYSEIYSAPSSVVEWGEIHDVLGVAPATIFATILI
jgi:hypothetical protein